MREKNRAKKIEILLRVRSKRVKKNFPKNDINEICTARERRLMCITNSSNNIKLNTLLLHYFQTKNFCGK